MPHSSKPQLLSVTPSVFGLLLQLRLHLHQWSLLALHRVEPQLLSMSTSGLQDQVHLENAYALPSLALAQGANLVIAGTQLLCADPEKTLRRRICLNGTAPLSRQGFSV